MRESATIAAGRGVPVIPIYCESHTREIPFHAVAGLLRGGLEIDDLDPDTARTRVRDRFPDADPEDVLLLEDLLAIRDTTVPLPDIAADARRRRLTALVNAASLELTETVVYVIEDVHWIDEPSEAMMAQFGRDPADTIAGVHHLPSRIPRCAGPSFGARRRWRCARSTGAGIGVDHGTAGR